MRDASTLDYSNEMSIDSYRLMWEERQLRSGSHLWVSSAVWEGGGRDGGGAQPERGRRERVGLAAEGEVAEVRGCDSRRWRESGGRPQRGAAGTAPFLPASLAAAAPRSRLTLL